MRRAFTLLEVMIAAAVLLVVGGLGVLLLVRTLTATARGQLRIDMQQQALNAVQKLVGDMKKSCAAGISIRSGDAPRAIAICPISQPDLRPGEPPPVQENGDLRWSSFFLIYSYNSAAGQLLYREWPPGSVVPTTLETAINNPRRLAPDRLAEVLAGTTPRQLVLVSGVTEFSISYGPDGSDEEFVQPITIKLVQQREGHTKTGLPEIFKFVRSVFLPEQRS